LLATIARRWRRTFGLFLLTFFQALEVPFMTNVIFLFQLISEAILRETAVVIDFAVRLPRSVYSGLRWGIASVGLSNSIASVISGYIVTGMLLGLLWLAANTIHKYRRNSAGKIAILAGNIAFWIGVGMGVYFLGLIFYSLPRPNFSDRELYLLAGTTVLYPALGRLIQYLLGR
jgi:hypothetical protein